MDGCNLWRPMAGLVIYAIDYAIDYSWCNLCTLPYKSGIYLTSGAIDYTVDSKRASGPFSTPPTLSSLQPINSAKGLTPMTTHTHTDTPDDQATSKVGIKGALVYVAERAANAQMEPLPATAYPLYVKKQGAGGPFNLPKKPRQEAVICKRCDLVSVVIGRLPIFHQTVQLRCGHRIVLQPGPQIVIPAALFRSPGGVRVLGALTRLLLPALRPKGQATGRRVHVR